jgi:hypothetical protein
MISAVETAKAQILALLATITTGNGYRNDVANVTTTLRAIENVTAFPEVTVDFNDERISTLSANKTAYQEYIETCIFAHVSSGTLPTNADGDALLVAGESMIHDLKRLLAANVTTHLTDNSNRWQIAGGPEFIRVHRALPIGKDRGTVAVEFKILIFAQDYQFNV